MSDLGGLKPLIITTAVIGKCMSLGHLSEIIHRSRKVNHKC